jgi:hypothetical protein
MGDYTVAVASTNWEKNIGFSPETGMPFKEFHSSFLN